MARQKATFNHGLLAQQLAGATMTLAEGAPARWDANYFAEQQLLGVSVFEIANASPSFIAAAHQHGMPVWAYTVNDEATMRTLIESGIDGIETDDPSLAVRVATELGVRTRSSGDVPAGTRLGVHQSRGQSGLRLVRTDRAMPVASAPDPLGAFVP